MLNWTHDQPKGSRDMFISILHTLKKCRNPVVLEIGCDDGSSISCIREHLPYAVCFATDDWEFITEATKALYFENTKGKSIDFLNGNSYLVLRKMSGHKKINFVYINISLGQTLDISYELLLAWYLLEKEGILGINNNDQENLHIASEHFLTKHEKEYTIISNDHSIFIRKN
jgi:trans-aconitate methyltransferase